MTCRDVRNAWLAREPSAPADAALALHRPTCADCAAWPLRRHPDVGRPPCPGARDHRRRGCLRHRIWPPKRPAGAPPGGVMSLTVGVIGLTHPHTPPHLRTLDVLSKVTGIALYDPDP